MRDFFWGSLLVVVLVVAACCVACLHGLLWVLKIGSRG